MKSDEPLPGGASDFTTPPLRRGGRSASFPLAVRGPAPAGFQLEVAVEHRDAGSTCWSTAGVAAALTTPGLAVLEVEDPKVELRMRFHVLTPGGGAVRVQTLPPRWRP